MRKKEEDNLKRIAQEDGNPLQQWAHARLRAWHKSLEAPKPPAPANPPLQIGQMPIGQCADCGRLFFTRENFIRFNHPTTQDLERVCHPCAQARYQKANQ